MKKIEMDKARRLRAQGRSINQITQELGVAKSSVSLWVRDVALTPEQRGELTARGRSVDSIERRRTARLSNERARRRVAFADAVAAVPSLSSNYLFTLGVALYWGEGSKTKRGSVEFTNSDPRSVQVMARFFKEICHVPESKFRGRVILHPHLDRRQAERYWSRISGIPLKQFQKTSMQHNKSSKGKKDTLPFGTFVIGIYDTTLYLQLMGWMEGLYAPSVRKGSYVSCRYHQFL